MHVAVDIDITIMRNRYGIDWEALMLSNSSSTAIVLSWRLSWR
jgi:hypothetical protein